MDTAQELIQSRGYNAFSYKDLAEAIGIRTASIHYHFATKSDLGVAVMERYIADLEASLAAIDRGGHSNRGKLERFIELYSEPEARGVICLCGSLASDRETLPAPLQKAISTYLKISERWLREAIRTGVRDQDFAFKGQPADAATLLLSSLQGGLLLSRAQGGKALVSTVQKVFLESLRGR